MFKPSNYDGVIFCVGSDHQKDGTSTQPPYFVELYCFSHPMITGPIAATSLILIHRVGLKKFIFVRIRYKSSQNIAYMRILITI